VRQIAYLIVALTALPYQTAPAQADSARDSVGHGHRPRPPRRDTSREFCHEARPLPECPGFVFTNFGVYVLSHPNTSLGPLRFVADWGVMPNVDSHDALGLSMFASIDEAGIAMGPAVHYRRWLDRRQSVEASLGAPLLIAPGEIRNTDLFSEVKWTFQEPYALSLRAEWIRQGYQAPRRGRVSFGMEIGQTPGLVLTFVGFLVYLGMVMAAAAD